jgi:hypothetical protein
VIPSAKKSLPMTFFKKSIQFVHFGKMLLLAMTVKVGMWFGRALATTEAGGGHNQN